MSDGPHMRALLNARLLFGAYGARWIRPNGDRVIGETGVSSSGRQARFARGVGRTWEAAYEAAAAWKKGGEK